MGLFSGCSGPQSALDPAGPQAQSLGALFWWMTAGTAIIWLAMIALTIYAIRVEPDPAKNAGRSRMLIVVGGTLIPTVVLAVLLTYGLAMLPAMVAPAPAGSLRIRVIGEQWWWRVQYEREGRLVELANEIRIPVNEPVQFELMSSNVIHAFWIPSLGGKRDMIPGRVIPIALTASRTGLFRGVCAEYCGASHALMSFIVEVMEKPAFESWLEQQAADARIPSNDDALRGQHLFVENGCGACHTVRGTPASGTMGPELTHVGSRFSLGAGVLTNDLSALEKWIASPDRIKPAAHMPAFGMLPPADQRALAAYLKGLE
ncbi:MAG TPA: cytochrome c oxidase subunit II [Verrucomicrobiae bacterium]|nr:cytochrome c oxidase subunit II [Verrucomicrobiae bacterium]